MHHRLRLIIITAVLLLTFFAIAGCSKVTQENYNKLKVGTAYDDVVAILGEPDECSSAVGLKNCTWGDEKKNITIQFAGQKVVFYSGQGLN